MRIDGKKLKITMIEKDCSRQALSDRSGVSTGTISSVCSGKSCSRLTARALAAALNMELDELLEVTDVERSKKEGLR